MRVSSILCSSFLIEVEDGSLVKYGSREYHQYKQNAYMYKLYTDAIYMYVFL